MKTKRFLKAAAVLAAVALLVFALLPVSSRRFKIEFDEEKIRSKRVYLEAVKGERSLLHEQERPNIVFILADDLGKADISLYGRSLVATPNIDAIGRGGVTFTDAYCTSPLCSPSRAAIMTGRYQQRFGYELQPNNRYPRNRSEYIVFKHILDIGFWRVAELAVPRKEDIARQGLPPGEITLAELLQSAGYATGLIGKWHLGHEQLFVPSRRGFDVQYGFYEAFTLYDQIDDPQVVNNPLNEFSDKHQWRQGRKATSAMRRDGRVIEETGYLTDRIAEEAIVFLQQHKEEPFFLFVPFSAPHVPYQAQRAYYEQLGHIEDRTRRVYNAMIKNLDDAVGRITAAIEELGLNRNTLLIFASDNGAAVHTGATDSAPLKGGKFTNFEGGLNVPFMIRWDGIVSPGGSCHDPVSLMDVFATAAAAAGISLPADRQFDGIDLLPFVRTGIDNAPHRTLYWRSLYNKAVRMGPWKLIVNERQDRVLLYNLLADREEKVNLAARYPEVVKELLEELKNWESELKVPLWPRVMDVEFVFDGLRFRFAI